MPINIANQFSPRRGAKTIMNDSTSTQSAIVLRAGELFIEYPDAGVGTGACKVKIGDGVTQYKDLPYAIENDASGATIDFDPDTSTTVATALSHVVSGASTAAIVAGLKQAVTLLNGEAIKSMTVDGNTITVTDNAVSFDSPDYTIGVTAASGTATVTLGAESGYGKTDSTFDISSSDSTIAIDIVSGALDLTANATGAISTVYATDLTASKAVVSDASGKISASSTTSTEIGYLSGVTSSIQDQLNSKAATITGAITTVVTEDLTASKVVVSNANGKIAASSVTTGELDYLSGVTAAVQTQLNGKAASAHTHTEDDITGYIDVAKLYGGASSADHKIDLSLIPQGALERLVIVADEAALRALTTSDVQLGDVVKVTATGLMYFVKDESALPVGPSGTISDAFEEFSAGTASSVPWSGITGKPETFPPSTHTHTMSEITDLYGNFSGATSAAAGTTGFVPAPAAGDEEKYLCGNGTWVAFTNATTAAAGLMSAEDKQAVELLKAGVYDFGDETPVTP